MGRQRPKWESRWTGNLSFLYNIRLQASVKSLCPKAMKLIFLFTLVASAALLSTSCNTMIGLGRDMRIGGESLESSANKVSGGGSGGGDMSGAPVY